MKIHRFFIKDAAIPDTDPKSLEIGSTISVSDENLVHQWAHVLRFEVGDQVSVFFGNGSEYGAAFADIGKKKAELTILSKKSTVVASKRATLALVSAVIRKERYEWLLEKGTELGVSHFYPISTEHSEEKGSYRKDRFEKIVIEATEQSGQTNIPEVYDVAPLNDVTEKLQAEGYTVLVADFEGAPVLEALQGLMSEGNTLKVAFLVGPEGGWGAGDKEYFSTLNITKVTLGQSVLRAETAAVVAASSVALLTPTK